MHAVCGLSGAADDWLIHWGGPLMISVANDLLNNSLGLYNGTDGRPNTYVDMFTSRCVHTCTQLHCILFAYIQTVVDTYSVLLSLPPAADTLGASCQHHPCSLIHPTSLLSISINKKLAKTLIFSLPGHQYWFTSFLSLLLCIILDICSTYL